MSLPKNIENHPFSQFDDSDVAIVQALWRAVESDTSLSSGLAQLARLFDVIKSFKILNSIQLTDI